MFVWFQVAQKRRQSSSVGRLRNGLPVTLSSDDPGIWGAKGLSHDWWEATVAWQLDTQALKTLAHNSTLGHGVLTEPFKSKAVLKSLKEAILLGTSQILMKNARR